MEQVALEAATHDVSLWALFMQAGLVVKLVMLGLIGEYVGRTFMTVSGKPQTIVRSITANTQTP